MSDFYADEDVKKGIVNILCSKGHNITTAQQAENPGLSNQEQLKYASDNGIPIITHNKIDFIKLHQSG
ncbi:MAG: DUF5615 family PIN-like protein [Alphaproteobacteria bacterium]